MKKKYILYGAIALFVIAAIAICIWYFSPKTFLKNTNANDVTSISVFNGSTGKSFVIENTDEIRYIVENVQSVEMKRDNISSNYNGFSFSLTLKNVDGKTIDSFIVYFPILITLRSVTFTVRRIADRSVYDIAVLPSNIPFPRQSIKSL